MLLKLTIGTAYQSTRRPKKYALAEALRQAGFGVTEYYGHGRECAVGIVEVITPRKRVDTVLKIAKSVDENAIVAVTEARTVLRGYWRVEERRLGR